MKFDKRIESITLLGNLLRAYDGETYPSGTHPLVKAAQLAYAENSWFTPENTRIALQSIGKALQPENIAKWLSCYESQLTGSFRQKVIGVVMAGNIPAVGFHDFLCVLISGNILKARLSSSDARLLPALAEILIGHIPEWEQQISFTTGKLDNFDAVIATGNNNTSRYFEYYFGKYPNIIRKNRNSVAIITGEEKQEELQNLADDIMLFFGMGCRSVSKIYVPADYDFSKLVSALGKYDYYANHHKYRNNYDYTSSIFMVNQIPFIDTGCLLLKEDQSFNSRIAVLHYEYYTEVSNVINALKLCRDSIQCVVSNISLPIPYVLPGQTQQPALWDYADDVDTLEFLLSKICF